MPMHSNPRTTMMEVASQPSDECLLVSLSFTDILGLLGAESRSPIIIRDEKRREAREEMHRNGSRKYEWLIPQWCTMHLWQENEWQFAQIIFITSIRSLALQPSSEIKMWPDKRVHIVATAWEPVSRRMAKITWNLMKWGDHLRLTTKKYTVINITSRSHPGSSVMVSMKGVLGENPSLYKRFNNLFNAPMNLCMNISCCNCRFIFAADSAHFSALPAYQKHGKEEVLMQLAPKISSSRMKAEHSLDLVIPLGYECKIFSREEASQQEKQAAAPAQQISLDREPFCINPALHKAQLPG
uniref:Uncharacterized protein n=1 Tax=Aegilops tauschii TaxID=37682 RepID=R7W9E1_AEGTA